MDDIAVIADLHCGHKAGLTPPDWQYKEGASSDDMAKFGPIQRKVWDWFSAKAESLAPVKTLIVNGDAIDGKGEGTGGTELLTSDRREQIEMAKQAIELFRAERIYLIRGTPYHVGKEEDWESELAKDVHAAKIGNHEWLERDGVVIDFKHRVSSSIIPHGRATAPARAALWNTMWAERGLQPKANILVRSHVHYHTFVGNADRLVLTTPCLQWWSKFGSLLCEGVIDVGFLSFSVEGEGRYSWTAHLMDMKWAAPLTSPM
jgi:hypothetical protein